MAMFNCYVSSPEGTGHMKLRSSLRFSIAHVARRVFNSMASLQLCAFTHGALGKEWFSNSVISYFGSLCSTWLSDRGPNWLAIIHFARNHLGNLWESNYPWRIHGAGIYIYTDIGGILMGSMLPYIAAPWIRHGLRFEKYPERGTRHAPEAGEPHISTSFRWRHSRGTALQDLLGALSISLADQASWMMLQIGDLFVHVFELLKESSYLDR